MKRINELKKPYKITVWCVAIFLVLIITALWVMFAFIEVNKVRNYGYSGYKYTRVIAHRGASSEYFDNTLQSFEKAGEDSFFDGIETDIRLTKDGVWVCSHDDNPFEDKNILISESNYIEIKNLTLDLSESHETADKSLLYTIPTYNDYLRICDRYNKFALIEIKGSYNAETLASAVNPAIELLGYDDAKFASFDLENIQGVLQVNNYARVLCFTNYAIVAYCYTNMGYNVGINHKIINKGVVERAHDKNTAVFVYTVNDQNMYEKFLNIQVDYIITDFSMAI